MRRWIIAAVTTLTLVGIVVVARARLDAPDAEALADRDPEVAAARALLRARNDSVQAWTAAYQRARVRAEVAALRPSSARFAVETRGAVAADTRTAFTEAFEAELRELPTPRVPVRLILVADSTMRNNAFLPWYRRPQRDGEPCVIVLRTRSSGGPASLQRLQRLGPCGLYAIAGMPGPGIAQWLDSTRALSALSYRPPRVVGSDPTPSFYLRGRWILSSLAPLACVAGRDEACPEALLNPLAQRRTLPRVDAEVDRSLVNAYSFQLEDFPGDVVASIRQSLGDERFLQWWASELPPVEAYERVSGRRFAVFARGLLRPHIGRKSSGPLSAGLPLALGLALAAGLGYWAVRGTPRART